MSSPDNRPLRIVIAGGGTGGHVLPAIAVIEEMRRRGTRFEALWIGSADGVEGEEAARAGIPFRTTPVGKLRRYLDPRTIPDAVRIPFGIAKSWLILHGFKPDVIFSTGGFVSVPTVVAGARGTPILTHEQTAVLGLATKIDLRFADAFAVSWDQTARLPSRLPAIVTGNPVRPSLLGGDRIQGFARYGFDPSVPLLYVTGGARGASPLNQRIGALLPALLDRCQIVHQTGPASMNPDAEDLRARAKTWSAETERRYFVTEFVGEELRDLYAAADLIVGRAGAGTVAELAALGKPAILIPLPNTGGDEQRVNAALLGDAGAAIVLDQNDATPERLNTEILALLDDPKRRATMSAAAATLAKPDAASRLLDELYASVGPDSRFDRFAQRRDARQR